MNDKLARQINQLSGKTLTSYFNFNGEITEILNSMGAEGKFSKEEMGDRCL